MAKAKVPTFRIRPVRPGGGIKNLGVVLTKRRGSRLAQIISGKAKPSDFAGKGGTGRGGRIRSGGGQ